MISAQGRPRCDTQPDISFVPPSAVTLKLDVAFGRPLFPFSASCGQPSDGVLPQPEPCNMGSRNGSRIIALQFPRQEKRYTTAPASQRKEGKGHSWAGKDQRKRERARAGPRAHGGKGTPSPSSSLLSFHATARPPGGFIDRH